MIKRLYQNIVNSFFKKPLYPEVNKAGGLGNALNLEFNKINSPLRVSSDETLNKMPVAYARVEKGNKFSQIYIAAEQKLYLPDFWKNGVCLAHGQTPNINELSKGLNFWLFENTSTQKLAETFSFIEPNEKAIAFDENREVEYTWKLIQADSSREEIKQLVDLAIKDEHLSMLFPFTSLNRLCFSRCTGFPYTHDTPIAIPIGDNKFEIRLPNGHSVGVGLAAEALKMIKDNLPLDIKPAIKGTAEDL